MEIKLRHVWTDTLKCTSVVYKRKLP